MTEREEIAVRERLHTALDLFDVGCEITRRRLRREHPEATETELDELVAQQFLNKARTEFRDTHLRVRATNQL